MQSKIMFSINKLNFKYILIDLLLKLIRALYFNVIKYSEFMLRMLCPRPQSNFL